jgi:ribosomal protein S18 acetylase RimI-like enzyme
MSPMTPMPLAALPPHTGVERVLEPLTAGDLHDLCDATEGAINSGGGFGWLAVPPIEVLERFWQGVVTMPARTLLVARLDGVVCGSAQVVLPPPNNEAQAHSAQIVTHFVAPWARGRGLAHALLDEAETVAREAGACVLTLSIRATQGEAIRLYESLGFTRFGTNPAHARVDGALVPGHHYYKMLD